MMASSDLSQIYKLLGNSLSGEESIRKDAESQLEQASNSVGFGLALLEVAAGSHTMDSAIRMAAAVYFKNLISKRYDPYDEKMPSLGDEEKTAIRAAIVSAAVNCPAVIRPLMIAASHKMIRSDFPKRWPSLVDELYPLMVGQDMDKVVTALSIFLEVVSWHGTSTDETKAILHGRVFPVLLELLMSKIDAASQAQVPAMNIVKTILKCFHAAIQYRFSEHLLMGEPFTKWCSVITRIIQLTPSAEIIAMTPAEAESFMYWKMKKWAVRIHCKIFQRFGCPKLDSYNNPDHGNFAKFYMEEVAIPVLNVFLGQIQLNLQGTNPYPERIFCFISELLESCLRHKKTWAVMEGHVLDLISHYYFPRLCFSAEDEELWEDDPEEYVRSKYDPFDELYSVSSSSISFIVDVIKCRKKSMFLPVLQFINQTLSSPGTPNRKDGALFILGSISRILISSDFKDQIEPVITTFVAPDLTATQGFLRMRALWVIEQFDDVQYSPQLCSGLLQGVLGCLRDKELPVRVAATGALGTLLDQEMAATALPPYIAPIMESILALANQIQLDSIAFVLERMVQMFADHLAPYAVQMCHQLRDTVARNLETYKCLFDNNESDADDAFGAGADKMMAVVGMFKAIETLIDSMSKAPELVAQMEDLVMPLIAMVLDRKIVDVYEEVFELIDSITFTRKQISQPLWNLLPYLHAAFKSVGCDYIQDMQTTFDNIISYGSATLVTNPTAMAIFADIIKSVMTEDEFSEHDRVYGCKLIESLLLNCRGHVDPLLPQWIDFVLPTIADEEMEFLTVIVHHLEVVINGLYYNPLATLNHLEARQATQIFFSRWFKLSDKFTRVHDKRLVISALSQVFTAVPVESLPPFLQSNWNHIMPIFLTAVQTLPKAMEARKKLEEEDPSDSEYDDYDSDFASEGDYDEINDDAEIATKQAVRSFVQSQGTSHDGADEDDYDDDDEDFEEDELEEELFFETPLDNIDYETVVKEGLRRTAQSQPHSFQILTSALNAEQSKLLASILN